MEMNAQLTTYHCVYSTALLHPEMDIGRRQFLLRREHDCAHDAHSTVHPPHITLDALEVAVVGMHVSSAAEHQQMAAPQATPSRPTACYAGSTGSGSTSEVARSRWPGQERARFGAGDVFRVEHAQALMSRTRPCIPTIPRPNDFFPCWGWRASVSG